MTLRIAICDDLIEERMYLAGLVRDYCSQHDLTAELQMFSSGDELLTMFRAGMFHILFLDIYMPGTNGMDTARKLRKQDLYCNILFATTSEDHGLDSYEVQASDYLVKPFQAEDVAAAMDWCVTKIRENYSCLSVNCDGKMEEIPLAELMYIEIQGHTASLHTKNGVVTTRRGMDELEEEISHPDFLRCHRSFLVNMNFIKWIEKNDFLLRSGELVPIGSTVAAKVKDSYMNWSFVKAWEKKV